MRKIIPYVLMAPLIFLLLILILGLINALVQSFGYIPSLGLSDISFDYYREIFRNPDFRDSLLLSLFICVVSSIFSIIIGIIICAALVYSPKNNFLNGYLIRIPILIPHTVVAFFSVLLFSQSGMLSRLLFSVGLISNPSDFPNFLYGSGGSGIIWGYVWKQAPFVAFFVFSLMESVSKTLEEAAVTLGASRLKAFFTITLPLSMPSILHVFLMIAAFSFGAYELPFLLGVTKPKALPVQAYVEYTHPDLKHRPYAMAVNGVIILVTFLIALVYFFVLNKKVGGFRKTYEK